MNEKGVSLIWNVMNSQKSKTQNKDPIKKIAMTSVNLVDER